MDKNQHSVVPLKRDRLGRVTTTAAQREEVLDAFERSGLKGREFAELAGVNYQTFAGWRWARSKQRQAMGEPPGAKTLFVEAVMGVTASSRSLSEALEVEMPGGVRLRILTPQHAVLAGHLLNSLRTPC